MNLRSPAAVAAAVVLLAGCGGTSEPEADDAPTSEAATTPSTPSTPAASKTSPGTTPVTPSAKGTVITTAASDFGTMLFDDTEQAIYIWERERSAEPACYDDCAEAWPPVLTDGAPVPSGDVRAGLLGTTERRDGTTQVTYNDHPLYFYADEAPGEVKCHNVTTHGGLWWVVQPNGNRAP